MTKIISALFISTISITIGLSQNEQFGIAVFEENERSPETIEEIIRIKNIDNDIFDSAIYISAEWGEIKFRLFEPPQEHSNETYPLVIVFHGSADIGTDNESQLKLFQKLFVDQNIQEVYPAYVLAPQFSSRSSDYSMDTVRKLLYSTPRPCLNSLFELVDSLKLNLNIDSKRIYLVGYSMGGSTVINSLSERPDLFAAGISISGIPQFDHIQDLTEIPIWLIHGTNDSVNPIESDEQLFQELSENVRFWKLVGKTHDNIVTVDILGDALPNWLFEKRKK